jgi:hypothetical protein
MAAEVQVQSVRCGRCGGSWAFPATTGAVVRETVAGLVRQNRLVEALRLLRERTGIGPGDAKAVAHHISSERGICHRCGDALQGGDPTLCPGCGSLNYDW